MRLVQAHWQTQSRRGASLAQMTVLVDLRKERIIRSTRRWPGWSVFVSPAIASSAIRISVKQATIMRGEVAIAGNVSKY
jgi:hypothetical protein